MPNAPDYKAELVGVFGHPVAENPTIVMIEAAFKELGLNWRYLTIEVYPADLADAFRGLRAFNMRGINLTIPHKVAVLSLLDEITPAATIIGAVNTVCRDGDRLRGENTDGKGFLRALRDDAQVDPAGKRVVLLGAGGAARAIAVELALAGAAHISIVNRSAERARALATLLAEKTPAASEFTPWQGDYAVPAGTDILVNATSIGLYPDVEARPAIDYATIAAGMTVCDVIVNPPNTRFLSEAARRGAQAIDGLGMLVYQGAIGFKLWTGHDAPVDVMRRALAQAFEHV
jgi:shikimate dehydrogenase